MKTTLSESPVRLRRPYFLLSLAAAALVCGSAQSATLFTNDTAIGVLDTNYEGAEIVVSNCTLTIDGAHAFSSFRLLAGSRLTHTYSSNGWLTIDAGSNYPSGLDLAVTNDVLVEAGSVIDLAGCGFGGGFGPGAGKTSGVPASGSGGGHGGFGGASGTNAGLTLVGDVYDSAVAPSEKGSGGGRGFGASDAGASGGGSIRLVAGGKLQVDGLITADGMAATNRRTGGGAGGTIKLSCATLAGFGEIRANGGDGEPGAGGGGGGGRIALDSASNLFGGKLAAHGGSGSGQGGPGSIYSRFGVSGHGEVLADNAGVAGYSSLMPETEPFGLTLRGGTILEVSGNRSVSSLLVASNSWIVLSNLALTVLSNAIIDAGGHVTADALGFPASQGPGAGAYFSTFPPGGSGGGHGGFGGECAASVSSPRGGNFYDSLLTPGVRGSGGGSLLPSPASASGGGVVRLIVSGALVVNGTISAEGGDGFGDGSGGASGGSIWISTGTLAGAGRISVDGGDGNGVGLYAGGGGAGGRISLQHQLNQFFGSLTARGGSGFNPGSAGTVYTKANNEPYGSVVVENGGALGKITSWTSGSSVELKVSGGGLVSLPASQTLNNLVVGANGWVVVTNQQITINGNLTVTAGGGIVADRTGYPSGMGSGMGRYDITLRAGSGGGFGGTGGAVLGSISATGGACYGSPVTPIEMGSGGGGSSTYGAGGSGGGSIRLNVTGNMVLDGIISANGGLGTGSGGGGGSGGTVSLNTSVFSGAGVVSANGGDGSLPGAGGGGGRISILATVNTFRGSTLARGGSGSNRGGAGTICSALKNQSTTQVLIDNGGQPGGTTTWTYSTSGMDLRIAGGAVWAPNYYQTLHRLVIASNSYVVLSNQSSTLMTAGLSVEPGGAILADGAGYAGGTGPGAGGYQSLQQGYVAGGGGYGGYGAGVTNTKPLGGNSYGSYTSPREMGSGGGGYYSSQGGRGGGTIGLTVTGALEVNGRISANGMSGTNAGAGGGAGGSIMISAGTLAGSGTISANGGPGQGGGGGGGGGRIAVQCSANTFVGALSAFGGAAGDENSFGGAGTVYVKLNNRSNGTLIVDNAGRLGTNTPLAAGSSPDLVISGGAVVQPASNQTLSSLLVGSNAWLMVTTQVVSVTDNATVLAGGGIIADGTGYPSFQGPGRGGAFNSPGYGFTAGGAGYGGYGSCGAGGSLAYGGIGYGSMTAPVDRGSGGGSSAQVSFGGSGGGAIRLNVLGVLAVAGRISAEGTMGLAPGSGGGSGGSIWITAGTLSGSGVISANGGAGNGWGGGGGGGRIALEHSTILFSGAVSAFGGYGESGSAGAGTVCWRKLPRPVGQVFADNGGRKGTNTSLSSLSPFDLTIRNGASVWLSSSSILLSNLVVGTGGTLAWRGGIDSCELTVLNDAMVESGGAVVADGKGFSAGVGPGAGSTLDLIGSGAGYGGLGGASPSSPGGVAYGSLTMPADRGSGGGGGLSVPGVAGGEGGGAIRLSVGHSLVINGSLTANGNPGLQDEAGGGSGGSIWIDAGVFSGVGLLSANGGNGEFNFGGGGGGGRVAIYSPLNFFGGLTSVEGGSGFQSGSPGTVYTSPAHALFVVSAQGPTGTLSSAVSQLDFTLASALNPYTASEADFSLMSPSGPVARENCFVTVPGSRTLRVAFPLQSLEGDYTVTLGPLPRDLYGNMLSQVHTGRFSIVWPQVHGSVADTNHQPLAGVVLQAGPGIPAAITDANGDYALKLPAGSTVTVTPSKEGWVFLPYSISYTNLSGDLWAQNYQGFGSSLLLMNCQVQGTNLLASWFGVGGLAYQMFSSTNLVDWIPWDGQFMGSNAPITQLLPISADPAGFYQLRLTGQQ